MYNPQTTPLWSGETTRGDWIFYILSLMIVVGIGVDVAYDLYTYKTIGQKCLIEGKEVELKNDQFEFYSTGHKSSKEFWVTIKKTGKTYPRDCTPIKVKREH